MLLHVTSLPGGHGIGDLGASAREFVDFLHSAGQRLWQVLPLTPLGLGNSPYSSPSAMAGNPLLISLDLLASEGLLGQADLKPDTPFRADRVDFSAVEAFKAGRLRRAYRVFAREASGQQRAAFEAFSRDNSFWLDDYALFMSLKEAHGGGLWVEWDPDLVTRRPEALARVREELADPVEFRRFAQFQFWRQWDALKRYANDRHVRILGDIPIFVALDSADVWARQELFYLDQRGRPTVVAGVPPDYFSETGQRWGNPLYRWDLMAERGYDWWLDRFRMVLRQMDLVRIDHFRGFEAYWEIPAEEETAVKGGWVKGPGEAFFRAVEGVLGRLPVVAEDLGLITPEVEELRLQLGYPGMKVLHFAFGGDADNPYLPHNYEQRCVAYTGTHDNDTTVGWFQSRSREERAAILRYLGTGGREIHWELIRELFRSVADAAIVPMQDVLGLPGSERMNLPGRSDGNWGWRMLPGQARPDHAARLKELTETYGRLGSRPGPG